MSAKLRHGLVDFVSKTEWKSRVNRCASRGEGECFLVYTERCSLYSAGFSVSEAIVEVVCVKDQNLLAD